MSLMQLIIISASIILCGLVVFQILLVFGLPFGKMAWGGEYNKLPVKLRVASLISSVLLAYGVLALLEKGGFLKIINSNFIISISLWAFVLIFGLSTLGNLTSKSKSEKIVMTPIAVYLVIAFLIATTG